jgi:hypothetical protein
MQNRSTRWAVLAAVVIVGPVAVTVRSQAPATAPAELPVSDYNQRVVAYIFGSIPITREDFGEYLIKRYGPEKLDLLVNKRIIEHICEQKGVSVSAAEVAASFEEDLSGMQLNRKDFIDKLLKVYGKSEYEWKEDVIRPRLLLTKLCQNQIQVTDDDLQKQHEMHFGEKVKCKLIMLPKGPGTGRSVQQVYAHARQSAEAFLEEARKQPNSTLAASGGDIAPIGRNMPGNDNLLEKEAFSLQPGDTSRLIESADSYFIMRCEARTPPDKTQTFEMHKERLRKEVFERKLQEEIPKMFKAMREQAAPTIFLKPSESADDLRQSVERELKGNKAIPAPGGLQPVGATAPRK